MYFPHVLTTNFANVRAHESISTLASTVLTNCDAHVITIFPAGNIISLKCRITIIVFKCFQVVINVLWQKNYQKMFTASCFFIFEKRSNIGSGLACAWALCYSPLTYSSVPEIGYVKAIHKVPDYFCQTSTINNIITNIMMIGGWVQLWSLTTS